MGKICDFQLVIYLYVNLHDFEIQKFVKFYEPILKK